MYIYHITREKDWQAAVNSGSYSAPSLVSEGFIHCSYQHQVTSTAERYYAGVGGLVLLEIDPSLLSARWVVEPSTGEELFPHVYGKIDVKAVNRVACFEPRPDGKFVFPEELG
jgi:uncharacterized protein (DUF952 family)